MNKADAFIALCFSFVAGVALNSFVKIPLLVGGIFLILGITLISVFWSIGRHKSIKGSSRFAPLGGAHSNNNNTKPTKFCSSTKASNLSRRTRGEARRDKLLTLIGFCLIILVFGIYRHQATVSKIENNLLRALNDKKQNIALTGVVVAEPDVKVDKVQLTIGRIQLVSTPTYSSPSFREGEEGGGGVKLLGKILVTTDRYAGYQYSDRLKIVGQLKSPAVFEDFNYRDYLVKDGIYSVSYWPEIELVANGQRDSFYAKILLFKVRDRLRAAVHRFLKPPQSEILAAMILGDKSSMSDELKEDLNIVGLRHITAISGLHITILAELLMLFAFALGLWRRQAFYFATGLLFLFIIMIGAPASAVRAGVMGGLLLLSQKVGRINQAWRALLFAAALMLFFNPLLLRLDVGFQLSFLAVLGINGFSHFFNNLLKFIPNFLKIRETAAMTLSAQILTLPILIYNFGQVSLVAPVVNILVVPLVAYILMAGFFGGLVGLLLPFLGLIVFFPAWLILSYVIKIIDWFSILPFSSARIKDVHWVWLVVFYVAIFLIYRFLSKKYAPTFMPRGAKGLKV